MDLRLTTAILAALGGALLHGCATATASGVAEERFAADFGCKDASATNVGGTTYRVNGCGETATYTCVRLTCMREYTDHEIARLARRGPSAARPAEPVRASAVERKFDEERQLHVVRARFPMPRARADVLLVGAPQAELTTVYAKVELRGSADRYAGCETLRIRVNDEPFDGLGTRVAKVSGYETEFSGRFDFSAFRPLARRFATFALDVCGQRIPFGDEQMPELLKFLQIFSDIAIDVQNEALPKKAPAGSGALEL